MRLPLHSFGLGDSLEQEAQRIFNQFIDLVRSKLLIFQAWLGASLSVLFLFKLYQDTWIYHLYTPQYFFLFILRIPVPVILTHILLKHQRIISGWLLYVVLNHLTVLVIINVTQNPHALIFVLFSTVGAAMVLPNWMVILLTLEIIAVTYVQMNRTFQGLPTDWGFSVLMYASIMASCLCIGFILQFMLRKFAFTTLTQQQHMLEQVTQRALTEQQLGDLRQRLRQFSLINHDLRQPLRIIQGHLQELKADPTDDTELIQPALAATQRAERQINNLLDQFRLEAGQQHRLYNPHATNLNTLIKSIARQLPGLARYHSDTIVHLDIQIAPLPTLTIDAEHLERALFNLLDNALRYANRSVALRAYTEAHELVLEVEDDGPGLEDQVYMHLMDATNLAATARSGFGLSQVRAAVALHNGALHIVRHTAGLCLQIRLPLSAFSPDSNSSEV